MLQPARSAPFPALQGNSRSAAAAVAGGGGGERKNNPRPQQNPAADLLLPSPAPNRDCEVSPFGTQPALPIEGATEQPAPEEQNKTKTRGFLRRLLQNETHKPTRACKASAGDHDIQGRFDLRKENTLVKMGVKKSISYLLCVWGWVRQRTVCMLGRR